MKSEFKILQERIRHLFQSKTIREYDEKDGKGRYKKDIKELDKIIEKSNLENESNGTKWIPMIHTENIEKVIIPKEEYIDIIASKNFLKGQLSVIEKEKMLYEQLGYLKGKNACTDIMFKQCVEAVAEVVANIMKKGDK